APVGLAQLVDVSPLVLRVAEHQAVALAAPDDALVLGARLVGPGGVEVRPARLAGRARDPALDRVAVVGAVDGVLAVDGRLVGDLARPLDHARDLARALHVTHARDPARALHVAHARDPTRALDVAVDRLLAVELLEPAVPEVAHPG